MEVDLKISQIFVVILICFYHIYSAQVESSSSSFTQLSSSSASVDSTSPSVSTVNQKLNQKGGYLSWRNKQNNNNKFKLVCYMTNWAQYRPNNTKFVPINIDPFLCTHLIYAFAAINTTTYEIRSFEWNDESKKNFVGRYEEFNNLKKINPKLKTLLAVGGWNMGSKAFSDMSKNETNRQIFIRSSVKFLRKWKFDGLDLDWEFPAKRDGSSPEDKQYFTYLVRDLREAFYNEAMSKRKEQLLLSAAVAAEKLTILRAYEIEAIVPHLDFISIMSYDYHGSWDKRLGHNSPLYSSGGDEDKKLTVDYTVRLYLTLGVPLEKLIVGIPYYGRSFTMKTKNMKNYGSECSGEGLAGEASREAGFLAYGFEICRYVKSENWTRIWSREHQTPYAYKNLQWVGYDDEESIKVKVDYINKHCLGGAMIWSIDLDDFNGVCSETNFPLTRLVANTLTSSMDRKKCMVLAKVTSDTDIDAYLSKVYKWVPSSNELVEESSIEKLRTFHMNGSFTHHHQHHHQPQQQLRQQSVYQKQFVIATNNPQPSTRKLNQAPSITMSMTTTSTKTTSTTTKSTSSVRPSKSPIYDIDYRNFSPMEGLWSEKLNDILQKAYKSNSQFSYSDQFLEKILKQFLNSTTTAKPHQFDLNNKNSNNYNYMIDTPSLINNNPYLFTSQSAAAFPVQQRFSPPPAVSEGETSIASTSLSTAETYSHISCSKLEDGEFVRDPFDCGVFYTCFMGKPSKRSKCDDGLAFDESIKVCNWKSQVNC